MIPVPALFVISLFLFILSLIGVQQCYFAARWKRFFLVLVCALVSGTTMLSQMYLLLAPPPAHDLPLIIRQPTTPL